MAKRSLVVKLLLAAGAVAAVVVVALLVIPGSSEDRAPRNASQAPVPQEEAATPEAPKQKQRGSPGWSMKPGTYTGRYRMVWSSDPKLAGSGQLTLFMRSVMEPKPGKLPSGILDLRGQEQTNVLYLSEFSHSKQRNVADVNIGNFGYAAVGRLRVLRIDPAGELITVSLTGEPDLRLDLRFRRYSNASHP
jgi:hypothetical protein